MQQSSPDSITYRYTQNLTILLLQPFGKRLDRLLMDTVQILCNLPNVKSFIGEFPSDILPYSITRSGTVIINADPHTEKGSRWLAIHSEPRASSAYYDSYGISPIIPAIQTHLRRNCTVWVYNTVKLQGLTSNVCGQNCCLFALYIDKGYTPKHFV